MQIAVQKSWLNCYVFFLSIDPSMCQSIYIFIHLFIYFKLSIHLFIYTYICQYIYLSIDL